LEFDLIGSRLAVNFANTAVKTNLAEDRLDTWSDLLAFLAATNTISPARAKALADLETRAPDETAALLRASLDLRGSVRGILQARTAGAPLAPEWIEQINSLLAATEGYDRLEPVPGVGGNGADWRIGFAAREQGLEWLLAAIARSAAEIVAEGPAAPVRRCANPKCGLFFYDDSRTGRRRWCSMSVCGNRSKVAAHFKRKRWKAA